jgi:hypothetical protein
VNIPPQSFAQFKRRNNLPRAGYQQAQSCELSGWQMNDRLPTQERAVGLKPEARKRKLSVPAACL